MIFSQHQQCQISVQHGFRRDVHIGFAVPLYAEDVDAVFSADVQLADAVPLPVLRYGDLNDGVLFVQLDVAKNMVGGVADGRPLRQLLFRVGNRVRAVSQQKLCLHVPLRAGHYIVCPQFLEQRRGFQ